jgi:Mg2+/Co2+ transporter CorC
MADSEPTHDNPRNTRNLPAVVPPNEVGRPIAESWLLRAIRTLFGWKAGSVRDDLQVVLDASQPDEVGFTAVERAMLRNILGLHERRIADVMVHRADMIAVKRDIPLGELMDLFESAAHSRLVVYDESLDDPVGMVHIRDLLAFMTARARVIGPTKSRRKKPLPAGLDLRAVDLSLPLSEANIIRKLLYVPPSMRAMDLLAQMQASRLHLALVVDEYGGTDGLVSMEDLVEQIVGEIDDEHDSDEPPAIVRQCPRQPRRCPLGDRRRLRTRRGRRGSRDARRLSGHPCRPAAGARRSDLRPRQFRDRGAGRRSAPGEAAAHRRAQGAAGPAHPARNPPPRGHARTERAATGQ